MHNLLNVLSSYEHHIAWVVDLEIWHQ